MNKGRLREVCVTVCMASAVACDRCVLWWRCGAPVHARPRELAQPIKMILGQVIEACVVISVLRIRVLCVLRYT